MVSNFTFVLFYCRVNSDLAAIYKEYESGDKAKTVYGEYANGFPTQVNESQEHTVHNCRPCIVYDDSHTSMYLT